MTVENKLSPELEKLLIELYSDLHYSLSDIKRFAYRDKLKKYIKFKDETILP